MKDEKKLYKNSVIICIFAFLFIVFLASFSYAFYFYSAEGDSEHSFEGCSLEMEFTDNNSIGLINTFPMADEEVDGYDPYIVSIDNNSECSSIHYYLNMGNYCNVCTKEGDICYLGEKQINCSDDYLIDPQYIKYEVTDTTTGKVFSGFNPEIMNIEDTFTSKGKKTYEIKLWISEDANNEDIYVYDSNGNILEDENGKYVTKSYISRLYTEVSLDKLDSENIAVIEERNFNISEDNIYSNKYSLNDFSSNNIKVLKNAWKSDTQYEFSFNGKCPLTLQKLSLRAIYTDGTFDDLSELVCNNNFVDSTVVKSDSNKNIEKIGLSYLGDDASTIFIKSIIVKEVR